MGESARVSVVINIPTKNPNFCCQVNHPGHQFRLHGNIGLTCELAEVKLGIRKLWLCYHPDFYRKNILVYLRFVTRSPGPSVQRLYVRARGLFREIQFTKRKRTDHAVP